MSELKSKELTQRDIDCLDATLGQLHIANNQMLMDRDPKTQLLNPVSESKYIDYMIAKNTEQFSDVRDAYSKIVESTDLDQLQERIFSNGGLSNAQKDDSNTLQLLSELKLISDKPENKKYFEEFHERYDEYVEGCNSLKNKINDPQTNLPEVEKKLLVADVLNGFADAKLELDNMGVIKGGVPIVNYFEDNVMSSEPQKPTNPPKNNDYDNKLG